MADTIYVITTSQPELTGYCTASDLSGECLYLLLWF